MSKGTIGNILFVMGAMITFGFVFLCAYYGIIHSDNGFAIGFAGVVLGAPFWIPGIIIGSWF